MPSRCSTTVHLLTPSTIPLLLLSAVVVPSIASCADDAGPPPAWLDEALDRPAGERDVPPQVGHGDRPELLASEGDVLVLGEVWAQHQPVTLTVRGASDGLVVDLDGTTVRVAVEYGVETDAGGAAHATFDVDDGHGGVTTVELTVFVLRLAWGEPVEWMAANGPRARRSAVSFRGDDGLYVLFGEATDGTEEPLGDAWRFRLDDRTWSPVALVGDVPVGGPGKALAAAGVVVLHGGVDGDGVSDALHRVTVVEPTVLAFERLAQTGTPAGRADHVLVPSGMPLGDLEPAADAAFTMTGGRAGAPDDPILLGDAWSLRVAADEARWIPLEGAQPPARFDAAAAVDPDAGRVYLHGGQGADGTLLSDTWVLDLRALAGPAWSRLAVGSPRPRRGALAVWDAPRSRVLLVGGEHGDGSPATEILALDEDVGAAAWIPLAPTGAPVATVDGVAFPSWRARESWPRVDLSEVWIGLGGAGERRFHVLSTAVPPDRGRYGP